MTMPAHSFIPLPNRGLIHLEGPEHIDFLQGLITADMAALPDKKILYGALLTAQGKFLHDFFVIQGDNYVMLDCEGGARAQDLFTRLKRYRLRAKVDISVEENHITYAVSTGGLPDPRHPALPRRSFEKPENATALPFATWDEQRIHLGIPDGSRDMQIEGDTLLECNFDRINGVAFTKGCYVGQEITARMNYRGLVKKRLRPVRWHDQSAIPAPFTDLHVDGTLIGQMRSACGPLGLALLKNSALPLPESTPFQVLEVKTS